MEQPHNHTHSSLPLRNVNRAFILGIVLNLAFVIIEFVTGISTNSLALMSDAGHNLSDVATLFLSLFAFQMTKRKPTAKFTYGFHKTTILASLTNAVILLIAVGSIGWEAIQRFLSPEETKGSVISIVAGVGIVINAASAFLFFKDKDRDLNVKGAYLHLALDALVSVGVVIAGLIISYTHLMWIDPLISLIIMAVVIYSTWGLLTESLLLSLDAVPSSIDLKKITSAMQNQKGIIRVHHVHVWAMSTTKNAMTAHLIIKTGLSEKEITETKHNIKHEMEHLNVQHVTLEIEYENC